MSFLTTTHKTHVVKTLPSQITKAHVLDLLHSPDRMIRMNPLVVSHTLLPAASSTAFFTSESKEQQPNAGETIPVFEVTETMGGDGAGGGSSWRGGWAKRFIPETISYETSLRRGERGMVSITHAPMGVQNVTTWALIEEDDKLILDESGVVKSNRMLMQFIKMTLQGSHEELVALVVAALEKGVAEEAGDATPEL
ncbi:hypothetical protein BJ878DRAFT_463104 [Calycina marina]|uniref:DUF7053 domain-containing protein n=1 Tax=Calycina marina TaxID=1763456 RepID=A0A9P7Z0Z4_9HELO|nr:hypothetical protein BJ878DRAFT_463104 [Calycina marina]